MPRQLFAQAVDELRRMWRDFVGSLCTTRQSAVREVRTILTELDAPRAEPAGRATRMWRWFRGAPVVVQVTAGLAAFALWAWFVVALFSRD